MMPDQIYDQEPVFPEEFIRKLPPFDYFDNPSVVTLCKRNEPALDYLRSQIERWFPNIPDKEKPDMRARLRSTDEKTHLPAFYELLLHQYCLEEGWLVDKNPVYNNLTPDFRVITGHGVEFYLEIFGLFPDKRERDRAIIFNSVLRELDKFKSPFLLSVYLRSWFDDKNSPKSFAKSVEKWIRSLPLTGGEKSFEKEFHEHGIHIAINAHLVLDKKTERNVCAWSSPGGSVDHPTERIKDTINRKLSKYKFVKNQNKPFVLIITADDLMFPETAIDWALYGLDVITFSAENPDLPAKFHKDNSGFITPNPGMSGRPLNTGLSAVMLVRKKWEGSMKYDMRVYHNPWAANPLPENVFEKMAQFVPVPAAPGFVSLDWKNKGTLIQFE